MSRSLVGGAAVYLLANILNAAIPFALLPVLTRYLSPQQYGQVAMFQALLAAMGALVGAGVVGAATRKYYDQELRQHELQAFIASCLQVLAGTSALASVLVFLFRGPLRGWTGLSDLWLFGTVLTAACSVVVQLRLSQWQVRQQPYRFAALQIGWSAVNMVLSLLLVVALVQGAQGRMGAQVLAGVLAALAALVLLCRDKLLSFLVWKPEYVKDALAFGLPLVPHLLGIFLVATLDRFVIGSKLGLASAGVYMVAVQLAGALGLVFDAVNKAFVPWLYERLKRNVAEEKRRIVRFTYAWYVLILAGAGLAFVLGPLAVRLVAGEKYAQAGDVIGWLALGQTFGGMYLMVTNYVFYAKSTGMLSVVTVASGLSNVLFLFTLIPLLGLRGAAVAFATAMGMRFLLTWWLAQSRHPMPWFGTRTT